MIPRVDWAKAPAWARWRHGAAERVKRAASALASVGRRTRVDGTLGLPAPRRSAPAAPPAPDAPTAPPPEG